MTMQAKTRKEVASEYNVDVKTLMRWLDKRGIELDKRDRLPPKVVLEIYDHLGCPIMPDDNSKYLKMTR